MYPRIAASHRPANIAAIEALLHRPDSPRRAQKYLDRAIVHALMHICLTNWRVKECRVADVSQAATLEESCLAPACARESSCCILIRSNFFRQVHMKCARDSGEHFDSAVACIDSRDETSGLIKAHEQALERRFSSKHHCDSCKAAFALIVRLCARLKRRTLNKPAHVVARSS